MVQIIIICSLGQLNVELIFLGVLQRGELLLIQKLRLYNGEFKMCIGKFDDKINEWKQMSLNHGYYYIFLSNGFGFNYKGDSICLSRDEGKHSEFCLSQDWVYFTDN